MSHRLFFQLTVMLGGMNLLTGGFAVAQQVEITGLPPHASAGALTGRVSGVEPGSHRLSHNLYVEGVGWWTVGGTNLPINPDGTFSIDVGTAGQDEFATHYSVSVVPQGSSVPTHQGSNELDLGPESLASAFARRYGTNVNFAGRSWGLKTGPFSAGPGGNRFTDDPGHVWVDSAGLHLTIRPSDGHWQSTEAILTESLGYGTYLFKTNSRQDQLDANATFGAFTWDVFGDDDEIPQWPNREIDFEDSRWGNGGDPTNSQVVVQPWWVPGNIQRITLPDLSGDATLTRFFTWSPGQIEFYTLLGDHHPSSFPPSAIIDHSVYVEDGSNRIVPEPGRENFRFNLWLNQAAPAGSFPIEVLITDFAYTGPGDFDFDGDYDCGDVDALVSEIAAAGNSTRFDLDGNGSVDAQDLAIWRTEAGAANLVSGNPYLIGDANLDGTVDGQDFIAWNNHKFSPTAAWCAGDFDANGIVDGQDFILWNNHKFTSVEDANVAPEVVPALSLLWGCWLLAQRRVTERSY